MNTQRKPGWVTFVAVVGIVLSGFGALGGVQEAMSPLMFEQQKQQYDQMIKEFGTITEELERYNDPANQGIINFMNWFVNAFEKILNMPDWYKTWMVISGILAMAINGFYMFGAIALMQLKPQAIRYLFIALPLSISLGVARTYFAYSAFDDTGLLFMSGTMAAIVIEIILLLILIKADKAPYRQFEA